MEHTIRRQTLGDLLRRTAARSPNKTAVVCGETSWSYAELNRICNRLAHGLAAHGVRPGDRVAILSRNSHAFVAVRFALARLGAVLVPINFMLNGAEAGFILRDSGAGLLCVGSDMVELGRTAAAHAPAVEGLIWLPGETEAQPPADMPTFAELLAERDDEPDVTLDSRMPLQLIYTSGTEALPKGAVLSHEAVLWEYVSCVIEGEMSADDVVLHALPLYHCAQLDVFLGPCVYVGATNIITGQPRPEVILPLLERHRISSFFAPPTIWIALLRSPLFDSTDLSVLRKGYYGASIMPVEVLLELQRRLPQVRLWNFYGQTEIAPLATVLKPEDQLRKAGSAGKPVLNVETRVVDADGNAVPPGVVGEIVHRSPQLLNGYYNNPEKTDEAFAGGWFHSGDLAVVDDEGYITIVDRKKDMIKSGGENVASREVEETIYRMAGVSEVAVIGVPDPYWVEAVVAVVVPKPDHTLSEAAVIAHCRACLAHFKVPKRVVFAESLPKNPSGKLLKRELRGRYG
ncbi:MAG: acyl-CoA synthetase [Chloroflexaceae bacterium]|jgi:fatty-acyl-CoA synthase|nr:acyl-CoA synthetase [Chloroflexaceae bacterium]